jgi:hypothetical protein
MTKDVIIVTGSRELWPKGLKHPDGTAHRWKGLDWDVQSFVRKTLNLYIPVCQILVHGAARGLDTLAHAWATDAGIEIDQYPANWESYGLKAGPRRNREMLTAYPYGVVVGFPGPNSAGTRDCMKEAVRRGMSVDCHPFDYSGPLPLTLDWKP